MMAHTGLVIVLTVIALVLADLYTTWVLVQRARRRGYEEGAGRVLGDAISQSCTEAIKAEGQRQEAYAKGKGEGYKQGHVDGIGRFMEHRCGTGPHAYDIGCLRCQTPAMRVTVNSGGGAATEGVRVHSGPHVPTGTQLPPPRPFFIPMPPKGVDFASGPDRSAVFWFHGTHRPGCPCNECTWPHKPNWRCDCAKCVRHFDVG